METLATQLYAFAVTILAGLTGSLLFDFYRFIRGFFNPGYWTTIVMDLLFWVILTPVLTVYLVIANWGELRFYVLIGILLGAILYFTLFSRLVIAILLWLFDFVSGITSNLLQLMLFIIAVPIGVIQDLGFIFKIKKRRTNFNSGLRIRWRPFSGLRWK